MPDINPLYTLTRNDLLGLVPKDAERNLYCSVGAVGKALKARRAAVEITGIEFDPDAAAKASKSLDRVLQLNLDAGGQSLDLPPAYFGCILYDNILSVLLD